METPDRSQAKSWEGRDVVDRDGHRLGRCVGVFADTATGVPEWLHVDVEGHVRSFVPAVEAAESGGDVRVRFTRDAVVGAPSVGDDDELSKAEEIELYRHYGIPVDTDEGSVLPADDATIGTGTTTTTTTTTPVAGTSDGVSTGASTTSGAQTSPDGGDVENAERQRDDMADTTAIVPVPPASKDDQPGTSALSDADTVSGAGVTPETGEELPVLDPAAASTPVQEEQVTYVSEPRDAVAEQPEESEPAEEQPRPALRRVPPASPPPQPAPSSTGTDLSALTPLGAVAGVAAAVAIVLQARDRRARRRARAAVRADRLGRSLRAGSSVALASASSALAGVPDVADRTRRSAAATTAKASRVAAKRQQEAAKAARRQRAQTAAALAAAAKAAGERKQAAASSLAAATKGAGQHKQATAASLGAASASAQKKAAQQRKAAAASLGAATASAQKKAAKQRKAAEKSLAAASKAAARQRKAAKASLTSGSSRSSSATDTVVAVPAKVAKRGRKVRKSLARKIWNTVVLGTAGGGYVLGAKAGRERYDELSQVAAAVAGSPKVQSATEAVSDPERRADLLAEVQQQAGSLMGRRGEPRS